MIKNTSLFAYLPSLFRVLVAGNSAYFVSEKGKDTDLSPFPLFSPYRPIFRFCLPRRCPARRGGNGACERPALLPAAGKAGRICALLVPQAHHGDKLEVEHAGAVRAPRRKVIAGAVQKVHISLVKVSLNSFSLSGFRSPNIPRHHTLYQQQNFFEA